MTNDETQVWIAAYVAVVRTHHHSHGWEAAAQAVIAYRNFEKHPEEWLPRAEKRKVKKPSLRRA